MHKNMIGTGLANEASKIIGNFVDDLTNLSDEADKNACEIAFNILTNVHALITKHYASRLNAYDVKETQTYFYFNVAEKLRELINTHSRRSRYLY